MRGSANLTTEGKHDPLPIIGSGDRRRRWRGQFHHFAAACALLAGGLPAAGQEAQPYRIKPSDIVLPQGVALGNYRRMIQPFENWNLICDENLQAKRKVCNISQSFVDESQAPVFSWSLAADESGKPFMILRAPAGIGAGSSIFLKFAGREKPVGVKLEGCDGSVCIGYVPVGPILREEIGKEATAQISYSMPSGATVGLDAPLKGLKAALSAIN
ncbi:invasion associated locus B family protein [Mesorhizobium sp. BAC0120]|uniref:invasion associated locus B family protein n=1 Tax=Mesorhizobium sp. BAC0120 TaxID=3090670 RepID=UPI00298BEE92|nr:invasion associated locus B family protein [Mesorhizobium sp. BAC0120]MDW6025960.1 invasion associated locus B family protein [Mesorhizobium sp. BAC0120]